MAEVVVVGGGAAGIIAAWKAASDGAQVTLLEKTNRIGTKVLISGGGKCNVTHDGPIEDVLRAFERNEGQFLRPSFYRFRPEQMTELLTERGIELYTRPDGRIFPVEQTAKDVVAALECLLSESGVDIRYNQAVNDIEFEMGQIVGVKTRNQERIATNHVILATGGSSYPNSGSSGDGWPWLRTLGHRIVPVRAALAPMVLDEPRGGATGISIRDGVLRARSGGKSFVKWRGDLLFTSAGISGPCALSISRKVAEMLEQQSVTVELDFLPDQTFESLAEMTRDWISEYPKKEIQTFLMRYAAPRVAELILADLGIDRHFAACQIPAAQRNKLIEALKGWTLGSIKEVVLDRGEVVAGGVDLGEVDPHSMRSKVIRGLYLCGEILDIAGPIGGYNLQAAWSTGFVAGESAAADFAV